MAETLGQLKADFDRRHSVLGLVTQVSSASLHFTNPRGEASLMCQSGTGTKA